MNSSDGKWHDIQELRDEIARLIGEKTELERQLADNRDTTRLLTLDRLVQSAALAFDGAAQSSSAAGSSIVFVANRYETELRGTFSLQGDQLALRLPAPGDAPGAGNVGTLRFSFTRTPTSDPALQERASAGRTLLLQAEAAQAAFARWTSEDGATVAQSLLALMTRLFSLQPRWLVAEVRVEAAALASETTALAAALGPRLSPAAQAKLAASSAALARLASDLSTATRTEAGHLLRLAIGVQVLVAMLAALRS